MKARLTARSVAALTSVAALALTGVMAVPAHAARSTVIIEESNTFTSLNSGTPANNITINGDIQYMTNMGLYHYDDNTKIVANTVLGSYKITKNTPTDFQVTYKINPGRVWSDGAPITAADLLLSHVLASSAYAKKAGLPDPSGDATPAFDSGAYTGVYDNHVVGIPTLSDDQMSLVVKYDAQVPDYILQGPNTPFPVHALELLAAGKKSLGTIAEDNAATAKFVKDVTTYNTAALKAMGDVYNTGYDLTAVTNSTNPLLLVCNGAYQVDSADVNQVKLVLNPKYNSGPATSGITTIVMKQGIADGAPSAQALANKDVDAYQGQPTADTIAQIKALKGVTLVTPSSFAYEHIELRVASQDGKAYNGPFAASGGQKAKDLRKAFLLAYPRAEIVTKLIKPINPDATVIGSTWTLPGSPGYDAVAANNGSAAYNQGTQAERTAAALKIVQQYYPTAGKSTPVKINLLWGSPGNARRTSEAALIIAEEAKAGFAVTAPATKGWGGKLASSDYDAHFFIFDQTAIPQDAQACGTFKTGAGSNYTGYSNKKVDDACAQLQAKALPASTVNRLQVVAERQINADAFFLGIFQNPNVTAWDSAIQGIKPSPLSPTLVWNFWEWHF
jgi:peptide/nickel transport system substrate-binding protein